MAGCEIKSENSFYDKWIEVNVWKTTEEMVHLFILDCIMVCGQSISRGCTSWVVLDHETCLDNPASHRCNAVGQCLSCSRIRWVTSAQVDDGIEKWIIGRIDIVELMFITGVGEEKWYSEMDTRCMACVVRLLGEGISTVLLPWKGQSKGNHCIWAEGML